MASTPRVYNIPIESPFLETLARAMLSGFPRDGGERPPPDEFCRWTILLPTRRACGELERCLYRMSGAGALLLPRIRAIGDVDEDFMGDQPLVPAIDDAISSMGRDFALVALIEEWSAANPRSVLAQKISESPMQAHAMAVSLGELIDEFETEEVDLDRLPDLYDVEYAAHREAILDLLALVRVNYPEFLQQTGQIGQRRRRSLLLRREAALLEENPPLHPLIAAGSTGSIPATRALLKAIAASPNGAVVLPGLDRHMDEESWAALGPQHPQFILKQLLAGMEMAREEVRLVPGTAYGHRSLLASEVMRPTETSESWTETIRTSGDAIRQAMAGIELVKLQAGRDEAVAIALMFRKFRERPGVSVSLVTPDRALARRVKSELGRWNLEIADSAGDPLIGFSGAALLGLLAEAIIGGFGPAQLKSLLHHELCRFGLAAGEDRRSAGIIDIAWSSGGRLVRIGGLAQFVDEMQALSVSDPHAHPALKQIVEGDWVTARDFAQRAANALSQLSAWTVAPLAGQFEAIFAAAEEMAGPALWDGDEGQMLLRLRDLLPREAERAGPRSLGDAAAILLHQLRSLTIIHNRGSESRFSILGLLEARLLAPDVMILGGLNEGTWPGQPDTGPWLNRPMRKALGMEQPERGIGQMAHDFVQGLGNREVYLVWSRREAGDPQIPSRWILRLQMLLKSAEVVSADGGWRGFTAALDRASAVTPRERPQPKPPVRARPRSFSVTRVETLIRDPYAIYAGTILKLRPLLQVSTATNFALRGSLIHAAIGDFLRQYPRDLPADVERELIRHGEVHFAPLKDDPDVAGLWWPDFLRMAGWLASDEIERRAGVENIVAETGGAIEISLADGSYRLTCRADRIEFMADGTARLVDYKTGTLPDASDVKSGHAPQLTLEAVVFLQGGFTGLAARPISALQYVKLKGGATPGVAKTVKLDEPIPDCAAKHFDGLKRLLTSYANEDQPYLPRAGRVKEDDELDHDHLSRYREWHLSGGAE